MKKKIDFRLYKYVLKQLFIPGIILGVICVAASITNMATPKDYDSYHYYSRFFVVEFARFHNSQPTAASVAPALIAFMYLGSALFTYISFKYQNGRDSSDFFDSLSYTRKNNFLSRILATLTWQYGIIIISLVASVITMLSAGVTFCWGFIPKLLLSYIAGSTLIVGTIAVGMSVTGTLPANLMAFFSILFLPRFLLFVMDRYIIGASYKIFTDVSKMGIFLNPVYNIPSAIILDITRKWQYYGTSETLINGGAIVYTMILGLLYLAGAMFLSKRRPAELAGRGVSRKLYSVILSSCVACFFLAYAFYNFSKTGVFTLLYGNSNQKAFLFIAIGALAFFISIFVLRRELKSLLISIPVFAAVAAMSLGFVYISKEIGIKVNNIIPDIEQIEYIKLNECSDAISRFKPVYKYRDLLSKEIEFTEEAIIYSMYYNLQKNIESINTAREKGLNSAQGTRGEIYCEFKLKSGRSIYRNVQLTEKYFKDLQMHIAANPEYVKNSYTLPSVDTVHEVLLSSPVQTINNSDFPNKLYDKFVKEYGFLDKEDKNALLFRYNYPSSFLLEHTDYYGEYSYEHRIAQLRVTGCYNGFNYSNMFYLNELVPMTTTIYMNEANSKSRAMAFNKIEMLLSAEELDYSSYEFRLAPIHLLDNSLIINEAYIPYYQHNFSYSYSLSEQEFLSILSMIDPEDTENVSFDSNIFSLNFHFNNYDESYEQATFTIYANISNDEAIKIEEYFASDE